VQANKYFPDKKRHYEELVLTEIGIDFSVIDNVRAAWWQNPINPVSLRLTRRGFEFFNRAKLHFHEIPLPTNQTVTPKIMLQLERLFDEPYYLRFCYIYVLSEKDAIMLNLHAGDLACYLDNLESQ
jgi:hypothetical protein